MVQECKDAATLAFSAAAAASDQKTFVQFSSVQMKSAMFTDQTKLLNLTLTTKRNQRFVSKKTYLLVRH